MERYANRVRRLVVVFVFIVLGGMVYGQTEKQGLLDYYGHFNIGLSVNDSKIFTDSLTSLKYDFGAGANLEYEWFFTDKLSVYASAGLSFIKSSTKAKSISLSLLAADFRIAPKYSLNGKVHLIAGPTVLYNINTELKTSYLEETGTKVKYIDEIQYGAFAGFELYLNDWSALRSLALVRTKSVSFELTYVITPKLASKK
jgi:hypothetical protein